MKVKGRDKPTATVRTLDDGTVQFRIDFELRPDAWAEIQMTSAELLALAHSQPEDQSDELLPVRLLRNLINQIVPEETT